jgi:prepilin-type N-terminal cleavage/methylation domain-containing protein/prepilin-type processing-associated H-X9-DG protein
MNRSNHGFTLVELLVVITIIGFLMALLIPAVNSVRESGRQTKCLNNQRELGQAIIMYESAKNRLPGVISNTHEPKSAGGVDYSWVEALFPYLEHSDIWETLVNSGSASIATLRVAVTVCPNDPYLNDPTSVNAQALLSYGVNDQFFVDYSSNQPAAVDRYGTVVEPANRAKLTLRTNPQASLLYIPPAPSPPPRAQLVSPSVTIMIGERTGNGSLTYPRAGNAGFPEAGKWTSTGATDWNDLTFHWPIRSDVTTSPPPWPPSSPPPPPQWPAPPTWPPTSTSAPPQWPISPYFMVSSHPGKVVVVFFDGHGENVPNDTMYPQ